MFKTATKTQSKLRLALVGSAGSGKTFSALALATNLGSRVAVIDTERGSASKYSDLFKFDVGELSTHHPEQYIEAIRLAEEAGYDVLIIDSLSHAWSGRDGALELVDKAAKKSQSQNSYMAWRDVTPLHNQLVDAILNSRCHVIATMRAKTEYVLETKNGKQVPRKVGMAPIQRDGVEYEFDVTADLTPDHDMIISKTRCNLLDGQVYHKPGKQVADTLLKWLSDGAEPATPVTFIPASAVVIDTTDMPPDDTADHLLALSDLLKLLEVPEHFLDTYLKKRWNGGKPIAASFVMTDADHDEALKDIGQVAEAIKLRKETGTEVTEEFLKGVFKAICAQQ